MYSLISFSQEIDSVVVKYEKDIKNAQLDSLKVKLLLKLGSYQKSRNPNQLPIYHKRIKEIFKRANYNYTQQEILMLIQSGLYKRRTLNYSGALKDYLAAQKIILANNDSLNLAINFGNIATLYKYQGECEKSILNFSKAIRINKHIKNYKKLATNYSSVARCYTNTNKVDSAFFALDQAIYYGKLSGIEEILQRAYGNKAFLLAQNKKYNEALPLQLNYLKYAKSINKNLSIIATNTNLARTYFGLKKYELALAHTNDAINLGIKINTTSRIDKAYKIRSEIYKKLGKYELALDDLYAYNKIQQEINNINNAKQLREIELNNSYEKERVKDSVIHAEEKRRIELNADRQRLKKQLYFAILIIMVILGSVIIYYGFRLFKRIRKNNQIKEAQLNKEIINLNSEVSTKKEEVNQLLTETLIHLRTKEKLAEDLSKLSKEEEGVSLRSIIADLKADKLEDSKIVILKQNIETLNYDFLKTLKNQHPNLTKTDIEVCSFIKIGLSRKEISNLRKTSIDAIKSTRFRLKKKLNLNRKDSLDEYIRTL